MLYRRSVNKLMHRAILLSRRHGRLPFRFRFNKSPGICIKIPNSYSSASPWISTIRDLATNRRLFLLDRPRLMICYAEKRVAGLAGGREGGGVGNRIACLPRIFPPSCGNSFHGSERRAAKTELCDYIPL